MEHDYNHPTTTDNSCDQTAKAACFTPLIPVWNSLGSVRGKSPLSAFLFMIFMLMMALPASMTAQDACIPTDPLDIPNPLHDETCTTTADNCTSKDLELVGAFLDIGNGCNSCDSGEEITATLYLSINNTTGSERTSFAVFGDLVTTDPLGNETTCTISRCTGTIPPNTITTLPYGQITFTCGDALKLTDLLLSWTDASPNSTCGNHDCKEVAPKCGFVPEIAIAPPLQSSAVAVCDGPVIDVGLTVQGGTAPFTYAWTGPNGFTATSEDLNDVAPGTYMVTVTDADACTTMASATQDVCCEFLATCPAETDLGDYNCNELGNIPAPPTLATVEAAPYNISIGDNPCGDIVVQSSDDIPDYNVCTPGGQTVTRTVTIFDDLDSDGTLDLNEESQVCTFTFYIVEDTTAPVLAGIPADTTVECDMVPDPASPTASD
ncbi:MAG: hypothetical protein OEQ81_12665, partial [Flavobacteriaceae bacterium]|nr:hypothetical protein [Flavobacteriaceae bacterium]